MATDADEFVKTIKERATLRTGPVVAVNSEQLNGNYIQGTVNEFAGVWYLRTGPDGPDAAPSVNWQEVSGGGGGGGGLQFFAESQGGTQITSTFTPVGGAADINFAVTPKGTGAIVVTQPDDAVTGGNARGENAVDLQKVRIDATQVASGDNSFICGGIQNTASGNFSSVSGGGLNEASGVGSNVSGGGENTASGDLSTVSGGGLNEASGTGSAISGGQNNVTSGLNAAVGGGEDNSASGLNAAVGGGDNNNAPGAVSTISGGENNNAFGLLASIGGGRDNMASGEFSFAVGRECIASANNSIAIGYRNLNGEFLNSERIFMIGDPGAIPPVRRNLFSVTADGFSHSLSGSDSGGADLAEWMESALKQKIPRGTSVVIDQGKIRPAKSGEIPFAVISTSPGFIGNSAEVDWYGKYARDAQGQMILEQVEVEEEVPQTRDVTRTKTELVEKIINGEEVYQKVTKTEVVKETVMKEIKVMDEHGKQIDTIKKPVMVKVKKMEPKRKLNPNFNPNLPYTPRSERPEWNLVGFLGQIPVLKGQPLNPKWSKLREIDAQYDLVMVMP